MSRQPKSGKCYPQGFETPKAAGKLVERKMLGVNPKKEQFEPTEASPVSQHKRMAGGG